MAKQNEWHCWEITRCGNQESCLARREAGARACWEVALDLDDFRSGLNVCKDCIVYISKQRSSVLTSAEVQEILSRKVECVLAGNCPQMGE
ncbi:hypothetical protein ACUUL3_02650 [Thiovibrio sp. JS02]